MTNSERAAYLKGLMDGLDLDPNDKVTKVLGAVSDLLTGLSQDLESLEDTVQALDQRMDEVDADLGDLEELYYGGDGEDEEFQVTCPSCGKDIALTDEMLCEDGITCPFCGERLAFDLEDDGEAGDGEEDLKF